MNLKNKSKIKKIFILIFGSIFFLFIVLDIISDAKELDAVNKIINKPSLLIFPIILMVLVASILILYKLYKNKRVVIKEKTKNLLSLIFYGFFALLYVFSFILYIFFLFYLTKITNIYSIEEILSYVRLLFSSPVSIFSLIISLTVYIGIFIFFLRNFLKYLKKVKNSKKL